MPFVLGADWEDAWTAVVVAVGDLVVRAHGPGEEWASPSTASEHWSQRHTAHRDDVRRTQTVAVRKYDENTCRGSADTPRRIQRWSGRFPSFYSFQQCLYKKYLYGTVVFCWCIQRPVWQMVYKTVVIVGNSSVYCWCQIVAVILCLLVFVLENTWKLLLVVLLMCSVKVWRLVCFKVANTIEENSESFQ